MCGIVGPSSHTRIRVLQNWSLLLLSLTLPSEPSRVAHDATRLGRCTEVWRPMASMSQAADDGARGGGLENTDSPTTTSESPSQSQSQPQFQADLGIKSICRNFAPCSSVNPQYHTSPLERRPPRVIWPPSCTR